MKRIFCLLTRRVLTATLLLACCTSCSIKEKRWACPCHLVFEPSDRIDLDRDGGFTLTVFEGGDKELSQNFPWQSIRDNNYIAVVSKGEKYMSIIQNKEKQYISGTSLLITEGEQADSIYASSLRASCTDDVCPVPVKPEKQYVRMHIVMKGYAHHDDFPFIARIHGEVCGIDLLSLQPVPGAFFFKPECCESTSAELEPTVRKVMKDRGYDAVWDSSEVRYVIRIPRLKGDSEEELTLKLYDKSNPSSDCESVNISLSTLITNSGFDWSREALEDVFLSLDLTSTDGSVSVMEWSSGWSGSIRI